MRRSDREIRETGVRRVRRSSGNAYAEIMRGRRSRDDEEQYGKTAYGAYGKSGKRAAENDYNEYEESGGYDYDEYEDEEEYDTYEAYGEDEAEAYDIKAERKRQRREQNASGKTQKKERKNAVRRGKGKHRGFKLLFAVLLFCIGFFAVKGLLSGRNWTIAVFGVDARDGNLENGTRSDVIMLVNVDKKTGAVKLVSVYRDTYLKISEDEYHKINEAYDRGGHEQAIAALEENLDVKIDDYVTFSWSAVAKGINALGGVDVEISDAEFYYINAFITETVNATGIGSVQLASAGLNHLDGVQAVAYGRLRLMDTDFNRTARQRKIIGLAVDKAKQADAKTLIAAAQAVLSEVSTSIGIDDLVPMLMDIGKYEIAESTGFPFSRETAMIGKKDCVVPTTLSSNVTALHAMLYGEENYQPSKAVEEISARISADSGFYEAGEAAPNYGTGGGNAPKTPSGNGSQSGNAPAAGENDSAEQETAAEAAEEMSAETEESESKDETGESGGNHDETGEDTEASAGDGEAEADSGHGGSESFEHGASEENTPGNQGNETSSGNEAAGPAAEEKGPNQGNGPVLGNESNIGNGPGENENSGVLSPTSEETANPTASGAAGGSINGPGENGSDNAAASGPGIQNGAPAGPAGSTPAAGPGLAGDKTANSGPSEIGPGV